MEFVHKSVLFDEAIKALDLNENKIIVDGTAGGGGHSGEIAKRAKRVISIDQDPDAITVLNERLGDKENVTIVHDNYSNIKNIISNLNIEKIDAFRQKCYNRFNDITRRGLTGDGQFVEIR